MPTVCAKYYASDQIQITLHTSHSTLAIHINHTNVYSVIGDGAKFPRQTRFSGDSTHVSQNSSFYARSYPAAPSRPVFYGCRGYSPPHGGVSRALHQGSGPVEGVCRHPE